MRGRTRREKNAKRAENEEFNHIVNGDGTVTILNESHTVASDHQYTVSMRNGFVIDCTCDHRQYRGERCKHMISVKNEVVPSLADNYGINSDNSDNSDRKSIELTASERRDIRGALANEMTDALTAGCESDAERLRELRARFPE